MTADTRSSADAFDPEDRPRRSVLYVPASNAKAVEKVKTLPVDAVILDLEDAVAPEKKAEARNAAAAAVRAGGFGPREVAVRINGLETPWGEEDLRAIAPTGPDAILAPKINAAAQLEELDAFLQRAGAPERTRIWAMMETPRGALHAESIAAATPRLDVFIMGTNDLAKDLGAAQTPDRQPLVTALGLCLLAARAYGVACVDGVFNAFKDEAGFEAACRQSLEFGFDGRTLIHPKQVDIANRVFAPSEAALERARAQVAAYDAAIAKGEAVAVVEGEIVENLHVAAAKRLLRQAERIAALSG